MNNEALSEVTIESDCDSKDSKRTCRNVEKCPECKSQNLIHDYDTGETVCADCGLVLYNKMIDKGPEWRAFTKEENASRSRVGMPSKFSVYDKGLSTNIGPVDRDALGRKLPSTTRLLMWRLRKWQIRTRVHSSANRNLLYAMAQLDRIKDKLSITESTKEIAAIIYRKALDKGIVRGRSIAAMATGALYVACRQNRVQRTLNEIAKASSIPKNEVASCYNLLLRELNMSMPVNDPIFCVSRIAEKLRISGRTQGIAINILREAKKKRLSAGKGPMGLAGAALYIAGLKNQEKKTQKDIAIAAGVTEVTIRNRYKKLKKELNLHLPQC